MTAFFDRYIKEYEPLQRLYTPILDHRYANIFNEALTYEIQLPEMFTPENYCYLINRLIDTLEDKYFNNRSPNEYQLSKRILLYALSLKRLDGGDAIPRYDKLFDRMTPALIKIHDLKPPADLLIKLPVVELRYKYDIDTLLANLEWIGRR